MNTELLKELYRVFSPSGCTRKMRRLLKREIALRGGKFVQDAAGNLLVTKGEAEEYPCLACHYDQVSCHTHPKDFRCIESGGVILGWSDKLRQQCGLGADDKNGVFICLNALERFGALKVAFFVDEEIGCVGSSSVDMSFFADVRFVIEPDRRDGDNLITSMSGCRVCSDDFIRDCGYAGYGYRFDEGSLTDVLTLLEKGLGVSCLNLSCGYYHPHTDREVTVLPELENCQDFVFHMVETMERRYLFELEPYSGARGSLYGSMAEESDYDALDIIVSSEPGISFGEVLAYGYSFNTKDPVRLRGMYESVKALYDRSGGYWREDYYRDEGDGTL